MASAEQLLQTLQHAHRAASVRFVPTTLTDSPSSFAPEPALLQGLLICGCCGRALTVRYQGNGGLYPLYLCSARRREGLATTDCMNIRSDLLDNAIGEAALTALQPPELKLAVTALNELAL
nr:zinc ribbon domain-containing protein [Paraburkholderia pallida]